jgi:undecaprenyl-diphosphatase
MTNTRSEFFLVSVFTVTVFALVFVGFAVPVLAFDSKLATEGLSLWHAVVLGFVEGLTEFLPVSSTGHLLAAKDLMDLGQTEAAEKAIDSYIVSIQIGAIFAVIALYKKRVSQMYHGLRGRNSEGQRILLSLSVAFIPTAVIGLLLAEPVKNQLYGIRAIASAWIVGGVLILFAHQKRWLRQTGLPIERLSLSGAALVGVAQAFALWPGVSRSLITILALIAVGLSLGAAVEFSFLLGLVTLTAATIFELSKEGGNIIDHFGYVAPLLGLGVAFFSAMFSVKWMVNWLETKSFSVFGFYRIGIGALALLLMSIDVL